MLGIVHYTPRKKDGSSDRLIISIVVGVIMLLGIGLVASWLRGNAQESLEVIAVEVIEGDTIWSVIRNIYGPTKDIRQVVDETISLNNIRSGLIYPGMHIMVPFNGAGTASQPAYIQR